MRQTSTTHFLLEALDYQTRKLHDERRPLHPSMLAYVATPCINSHWHTDLTVCTPPPRAELVTAPQGPRRQGRLSQLMRCRLMQLCEIRMGMTRARLWHRPRGFSARGMGVALHWRQKFLAHFSPFLWLRGGLA